MKLVQKKLYHIILYAFVVFLFFNVLTLNDATKSIAFAQDNKMSTKDKENYDNGLAALMRGDYDTALRILLPYAAKGDAISQINVAACYFALGEDQEAVKWYHKAALQGYAAAQSGLGIAYINGFGVAQNYKEAVYWLRKAADQGHTVAQYNLGKLYYHGRGIPQDFIQAYFWFELAAKGYQKMIDEGFDMKQQKKDAIKMRKLAAKNLTRSQKKEARQKVTNWKPKER